MILKQYYLGCLARASYLIGDEESRLATIVDPERDVTQYLEDARQYGLTIFAVVLTHQPAEGLSGHEELCNLGADVYLGGRALGHVGCIPVQDGDGMDFGKLRLRFLETPGRSDEDVSVLVYDLASDPQQPYAVLTGQTLLIGDIGRPAMLSPAGVPAREMAGRLYDSLHGKLMSLPDETLVYPTHAVGSLCGRHVITDTVSTIGMQRRYNAALQPMSRKEFVQLCTADLPETPGFFAVDALMSRRLSEELDRTLSRVLKPLTLSEVLELRSAGAEVLDVRDAAEFAGAHLVGSINIGLRGRFASWASATLDPQRQIVLVANPGRELEAALRLGPEALDRLAGYLEGGMSALEGRPELLDWIERTTVTTLCEGLSSFAPPLVLDVRSEKEWHARRVEGSINIPLQHLRTRLGELPRRQRVAVICTSGYRSSLAASLLKRCGWAEVLDVVGGFVAWEAAALQTRLFTTEETNDLAMPAVA